MRILNEPRVAIVTVTMNAERYILQNLQNVAAQTLDVTHFVADGGSTDSTLALVREYKSRHPHVRLIKQKDRGIYDAMNLAIKKIASDFDVIALLNADDFYVSTDALQRAVSSLLESNADVLFTNVGYVQDIGSKLLRLTAYRSHHSLSRKFFLTGGQFAHPGMLAKAGVYSMLGYREELDISADYRFQVDLFLTGIKVSVDPMHLVNQRIGGYSQAGAKAFLRGKYQIYKASTDIFSPVLALVVVFANVVRKLLAKVTS